MLVIQVPIKNTSYHLLNLSAGNAARVENAQFTAALEANGTDLHSEFVCHDYAASVVTGANSGLDPYPPT